MSQQPPSIRILEQSQNPVPPPLPIRCQTIYRHILKHVIAQHESGEHPHQLQIKGLDNMLQDHLISPFQQAGFEIIIKDPFSFTLDWTNASDASFYQIMVSTVPDYSEFELIPQTSTVPTTQDDPPPSITPSGILMLIFYVFMMLIVAPGYLRPFSNLLLEFIQIGMYFFLFTMSMLTIGWIMGHNNNPLGIFKSQ